MNKKINISIVIPSLNGVKHLKDFLVKNLKLIKEAMGSLEEYNKIEMVVVNDNSTDDTLEYLAQCQKEYSFLIFDTNPKQGICSARNHGVKISSLSSYDKSFLNYVLNLDNDVLLDSFFFINAVKYLKTEPFCIACDGVSYFTKERQDGVKLLEFKRGFFRFTKNIYKDDLKTPSKVGIPSFGAQGAYFFIKSEDFLELNGFDENLDPYMLDDSDMVYRGLKRGKKCIYAPDVTGYHKVGGTIKSKVSEKTKMLSKRNRNYFMWKNLHSKKLLRQHYFFLFLSIFSKSGLKGLIESLRMYRVAKILNAKEKDFMKVSDVEILNASRDFKRLQE